MQQWSHGQFMVLIQEKKLVMTFCQGTSGVIVPNTSELSRDYYRVITDSLLRNRKLFIAFG